MAKNTISAVEMADAVGVDPRAFMAALRAADLAWRRQKASWIVKRDSPQHEDMKTVLANLLKAMRDARRS